MNGTFINNLGVLAGLGEDPGDLNTDSNPYLRLLQAVTQPPDAASGGYLDLAQRRLRTQRLTPGGLAQPPELEGVDADARVPNVLQPMAGEFAGGREISGGAPAFHNPTMPAPTGVANNETAAPGLLQQARMRQASGGGTAATTLTSLANAGIAPVGNERPADSVLIGHAAALLGQRGGLAAAKNVAKAGTKAGAKPRTGSS